MVYMVNWTAGGKWSRRLCGGSASPEEGEITISLGFTRGPQPALEEFSVMQNAAADSPRWFVHSWKLTAQNVTT